MGARQVRDEGQRRARSIRLALAGGGVVVTVIVAGVVQATTGAASTGTDQTPSVDAPDQSGVGQLPDGPTPAPTLARHPGSWPPVTRAAGSPTAARTGHEVRRCPPPRPARPLSRRRQRSGRSGRRPRGWSSPIRPSCLPPAPLMTEHLAAVGRAASRFDPDSEVSRLARAADVDSPVDQPAAGRSARHRPGRRPRPPTAPWTPRWAPCSRGLGYDRDLADVSAATVAASRPVAGRAGDLA